MNPYQNTNNQGLLDIFESNNRQLFFILGRQQDDQRKKVLSKEIEANSKLIDLIKKYQVYQKLKDQQKAIKICLQQTADLFKSLQQKKILQSNKIQSLKQKRSSYEKNIKTIKQGEQMLHLMHRYSQQIQIIQKAQQQIRPQQIVNYLPALNNIKSKVLEQKQQIQKKTQQVNRKKQQILSAIKQEDIHYEKLLNNKFNLTKQLEGIKGSRIMRKPGSSIRSETKQKIEEFRITKRIVSHRKIVQEVKIPIMYWIWAIILIIWSFGLILLPKVMKPDVCY